MKITGWWLWLVIAAVIVADGRFVPVRVDAAMAGGQSVPIGGRFGSGAFQGTNNAPAGQASNSIVLAQSVRWGFVNQTNKTLGQFQLHFWAGKQSNASNMIKEVLIENGGAGYSKATVAVSGGSGRGADIRAVVKGGVVSALYIYNQGSGWKEGELPTLKISGDGADATAHVTRMSGQGEVDYAYDSIVFGAIEYPAGKYSRVTWNNGSMQVTVHRGAVASSDPLDLQVPPGAAVYFWPRGKFVPSITFPTLAPTLTANRISSVEITNPGSGLWAPSYSISSSGGNGNPAATIKAYTYQGSVVFIDIVSGGKYSDTPKLNTFFVQERPTPSWSIYTDAFNNNGNADLTLSPLAQNPSQTTFSTFSMMTARPVEGALNGNVFIGDSIGVGFAGGESTGDPNGNFGWPSRILAAETVGTLKLAISGYYTSSFVQNHAGQLDLIKRAPGIRNAIIQTGTNDILRGDPLPTVQANTLSAASILKARGLKVWPTTIMPRSRSSDGFLTVAGQTPVAGYGPGSVQANYNDWLRAGAPIVNGVAVPIGTVGALLSGQPDHPFWSYFEVADQVESSRNSGVWQIIPNMVGGPSGDGDHPRDEFHAKVVGTTDSLTVVPGKGYTTASVTLSNLGIASADVTVSNGAVTGCTKVSDGGVVFDFVPMLRVRALGGTGSGAALAATLSDGTRGLLTGCTVIKPGSDYTRGALLSVAGALPPQISAGVVNGGVSLSLDFGGTSLKHPYAITISGDGKGATAVPIIARAIDPTVLN